MMEWSASVTKRVMIIASLIWLSAFQIVLGQCPSPEGVTVQASNEHSFSQNQGKITLLFSSALPQSLDSYRVRLYDTNQKQYVYDDNSPTFLNQVSAPEVDSQKLTFTQLPTGKYEVELHGGDCQYQRYQVAIIRE